MQVNDAFLLYNTLLAALTPYIVAFVIKQNASRETKIIIAVIVSIGLGFLQAILQNKFDGTQISASIIYIFMVSRQLYETIFKNSATWVEKNVNVNPN